MSNVISANSPNYSAHAPGATQTPEEMILETLTGIGPGGGGGEQQDPLAAMLQIFESLLPADAKALYERLKVRNDNDPLSSEFHKAFKGEPLRNLREALEAKFKDSGMQTHQAATMNQNPAAANTRRAEAGMHANYLQSQLLSQTNSGTPVAAYGASATAQSVPGALPQSAVMAKESMASTVKEVEDLGARIANGTEPATDADRTEWMQAQEKLKQSVTQYATEISKLPQDSPERAAAKAEMTKLSEKMTANELPVLARFDKGFGESWKQFHDQRPGSEGAVLPTRMKMYGITEEQMQRFVATGQEPEGLKKAVDNARRSGDWPALGVVRASYQMRADYLRATTQPNDVASRKQADQLDAASASLTRNRNSIQLNWGEEKFAKLNTKYPDDGTRPANIQKQIDEAKQAVSSVRSKAVEQVQAHPERYGKTSATRKLAGDALTTEARMVETEAKGKMAIEAKANNETIEAHNKTLKPDQQKVVAPPPKLHPDLLEGGTVDQKRTDAVKIDPSLGDVVNGGERASQFYRDTTNTKKLRLNINEQQIAHLNSKGQQPPAELVAKSNRQVEDIFKNTSETHDKLSQQKPGSLSVDQTRLISELSGDAVAYSAKASNIAHQKKQIEMDDRLKGASQGAIQRDNNRIDEAVKAFEKSKLERVQSEMQTKTAMGKVSINDIQKFADNPAEFAKAQPDTKEEAKYRTYLNDVKSEAGKMLDTAKTNAAAAKQKQEYNQKIDDQDGLNTDPDMATGLAKDALKRSEAHMKAIPASGPERLPRLQAAADYHSAAIGLSTVIRDNADRRMLRTELGHNQVELANSGFEQNMLDDSVHKSSEYVAKVRAEETEIKQSAFKDAKSAAADADQVRKNIGAELDARQTKVPKGVQAQQAGDVQAYKDSMALQQVRAQGVVAQLGADLDPNAAREQLEKGTKIINEELPYTHVSRTDKAQAAQEHSRNEMRMQALADHGDASLLVAQRAQLPGGAEYGMLIEDALSVAHKSAGDLDHTMTIDGGGAAGNTANKKLHEELKARNDALVKDAIEIDKSADPLKFADSIDKELATDVGEFHKLQADLQKAMKDQRGDAFGIFANTVSRIKGAVGGEGGDLNKMGVEIGNEYLKLGSWKGGAQEGELKRAAQTIRDMHAAGIPNHVIMSTLRDQRFSEIRPMYFNPKTIEEAQVAARKMRDEVSGQIKGRYGVTLPEEFMGAGFGIRGSSLGKVMDTARSNRTDNIVTYLGHKNTDLLKEGKAELREYADMANEDWKKVAPYAAATQVVDQVVFSMASGAALAGAFARVASFTRIPQAFASARGVAAGMSGVGRLGVLAGVNAAEAGVGMLTGHAISKTGEAIFGKGTAGAKAFDFIGGGFQITSASKVAMRSNLGFQAAMGLTLGGVPIAAQQLGASSELAEKIGMASGIFMPTVLGTMSNRSTLKRAEGVMVNELGLDPAKARALMGDMFHAESVMDPRFVKNGTFDVEGFTRDRAGKMVDSQFPGLNDKARTTILDTASLDAARRKINMEPPKAGSVKEQVAYIDEFHGKLESEMVKMGVKPDRARELVQAEKTAMYDQALTATNRRTGGEEGAPQGADANNPNAAGSSTRQMIDQVANGADRPLPDVQVLKSVPDANGKNAQQAAPGYKLIAVDESRGKAFVKSPDGSMKEVNSSDIVYVHDGQALGVLPPAVQKKFDDNFSKLGDPEKLQWTNMLGEANRKSPEHVQVLRKMLASGASMDDIQTMHRENLKLSHQEIGKQFSPVYLAQHLRKACVAACIQKADIFFNPKRGQDLQDPKAQLDGQKQIMENHDAGWEVRRGGTYPHNEAPPASDKQWREARPNPYDAKPPMLENALKQANYDDYNRFDVNVLDRRYIKEQLQSVSGDRPEFLFARKQDGSNVVYEVSKRDGDKIYVQKPGEKTGEWWDTKNIRLEEDLIKRPNGETHSEDKVVLPDGSVLSHIAVPPDRPVKQADSGLQIDRDSDIQKIVQASTGKKLERLNIKGDDALRAIYQSVQEIGVAGASVKWKGSETGHQLLVTGARDLGGGNYSFDVFDPTTGKTRTMSGEQLKSNYNSGHPNDKGIGVLDAVQVPDDLKVAKPTQSREEMSARNQMELHEPQKLKTLAEIDRVPDAQQRSVLTQLLRHQESPADIDLVLSNNFEAVKNLDPDTRKNLVSLFKPGDSLETRKALLELIPTVAKLPEAARNHAMERLGRMSEKDFQETAQRLQDLKIPKLERLDEDLAMEYAQRMFGK